VSDPAAAMPSGRDPRVRDLEAILFVADEPLTSVVLGQLIDVDRHEADRLLEALSAELEAASSGIVLRRVAGGWRLYTHPGSKAVVERFVLSSRHSRLTRAALETLAIVAYKQPVTRHQVEAIRGVNTEGVLRALVDRGLLAEVGREEGPGRPVLYGTTPEFLERLGLNSVSDLPPLAPLLGESSPTDRREADEDAEPERADGSPD
jgi:segregation and condensation protein B